jgi:hypothetical protein
MASNIINYEEQTKQLTTNKSELDARYEQTYMDFYTSSHMVKHLENQMSERSDLMKENKKFMQQLEAVTMISRKIAELETTTEPTEKTAGMLIKYKDLLKKSENKLYEITGNISSIKTTKEGLALQDLVNEWVAEVLKNEQAKAELEVLTKRKNEIDEEFSRYTPIGPSLKKQEREISVTENTYHTILDHLAQARLQQKNIEMKSTTITVVTEPIYPLAAVGSKRKFIILAAYLACFIFIIGCFLIVELLDKTVRDKNRARYLTKADIIGAFPGIPKLKYRGFAMETNRLATAYICNRLMPYFNASGTTIINVVSSEPQEGKTHVSNYLKEYWEEVGFTVSLVSHNTDFNIQSKDFIMARSLDDIYKNDAETSKNIIILEYPALSQSVIPKMLLQSGQVILYLVKATRAWKDTDKTYLDVLRSQAGKTPIFLCLNHARRFAVEEFTGLLPPYTRQRIFSYKLLQMELTSERSVNIEKENK